MIKEIVTAHNQKYHTHPEKFLATSKLVEGEGADVNMVIEKVKKLHIAIPSWALGAGGTRFGRFGGGGEPSNLEEKIADVSLIKQLSGATNSISLHIPWDIPGDVAAINDLLKANNLNIDSVNSNTFQDQPGQDFSYKFGSLCHTNEKVRQQAIAHNKNVIDHGLSLGCNTLTIWLADGSNFPGQQHFRRAYARTLDSLQKIYSHLPEDWTMLVEYKPYEPNFYRMVIPDWGTSKALCEGLGTQAKVLVDLGHHLPNTNIEQIVARLLHFNRLGGFHFNGSMYGDDDLTTGSIQPYQLFLIFNELVDADADDSIVEKAVSFMIDASHNTKNPIADLLQALNNIANAYAKALIVDRENLHQAQQHNNVVEAEQLLRNAFDTDVRSITAEARRQGGFALNPLQCFLENKFQEKLVQERGNKSVATGL